MQHAKKYQPLFSYFLFSKVLLTNLENLYSASEMSLFILFGIQIMMCSHIPTLFAHLIILRAMEDYKVYLIFMFELG